MATSMTISRLLPAVVALSGFLSGCGSDSNINQLWTKDEGADTLLAEAKAAYDSGDFDRAEELAEKALDRNSYNEGAAVLLGYVSLSQGGIDPYRLARALIDLGDTDSGSNLTQSDDTASDTLGSLSTLINLSDGDLNTLGTKVTDAPFSETNFVYTPNAVTTSVRDSVTVLRYMNKAVTAICPFVNAGAKVEGETRHDACETVDTPRVATGKSHFLWAFAHLTEALVYQTVLLYSGDSNSEQTSANSNLSKVTNDLETGDPSSFATNLESLTTTVGKVFEVTEDGSMIDTAVQALAAVENALNQLTGVPTKITSSLTKSLDKIKSVGDKVGGTDKALRGQMTQKIGKDVKKKVDTTLGGALQEAGLPTNTKVEDLAPQGDLTQEEIDEFKSICNSYDDLVEGVDPEKKETPANC